MAKGGFHHVGEIVRRVRVPCNADMFNQGSCSIYTEVGILASLGYTACNIDQSEKSYP